MIIPRRLSRIGWNQRILTINDFQEYCVKDGVQVFECPMKWSGAYYFVEQMPTIVLNSKLSASLRLLIGWHELAHHCLHVPEPQYFIYGKLDRKEYKAHLIAACALIPKTMLKVNIQELQEDYGYPFELLRFRARVFDQFKI